MTPRDPCLQHSEEHQEGQHLGQNRAWPPRKKGHRVPAPPNPSKMTESSAREQTRAQTEKTTREGVQKNGKPAPLTTPTRESGKTSKQKTPQWAPGPRSAHPRCAQKKNQSIEETDSPQQVHAQEPGRGKNRRPPAQPQRTGPERTSTGRKQLRRHSHLGYQDMPPRWPGASTTDPLLDHSTTGAGGNP